MQAETPRNMRQVVLKRVMMEPDGAFGVLTIDGKQLAVTCERTYRQPDGSQITKIPAGATTAWKSRFVRGGYDTFEIGVKGHARILFHRGNVETDSDGCVLVGRRFGTLNGKPAVLDSAGGFADFWNALKGEARFSLIVE